jgi:tetratricopeptide (TPR) repeat protein
MIVSPAIIHLHGQSYGLVLLNTDEETQKHRKKLQPVLVDSLRSAPLVVIGYSGSADGISQTLLDEFEGREPLYWIGYSEELATHLQGFGKKDHFQFLGGADFDRFMIELAQSLGCWPPRLFTDPFGHLLKELEPVIAYPVGDSDSSIDLLQSIRRKLDLLGHRMDEEERQVSSLHELYMKGDFEGAAKLYSSWDDKTVRSNEDRQIVYWSFIGWGNLLMEEAKRASGEEASKLFAGAEEKYDAALAIKPDGHETLTNWGSLLQEQAERASSEEAHNLFVVAGKKYMAALAIKPDSYESLYNFGNLLFEQAKRTRPEEASQLFAAAGKKYAAALAIKPDNHAALYNWGNLLFEQAKGASGEKASKFLAMAGAKYSAALAIKPDKHEALGNWGNALSEQAKRASGGEVSKFLAMAGEKFAAALVIKPDSPEALYGWGALLTEQAKRASGEQSSKFFAMAEEKLATVATLNPSMTYNFACLRALQRDEDQCRQYLENAELHGTLPDYGHLAVDTDLDSMREKQWFKELLDRQKVKAAR